MEHFINVSSEQGIRPRQEDRYLSVQIGETIILGIADANGELGGGELAELTLKSVLAHVGWHLSQNKNIFGIPELKELGLNAVNSAAQEAIRLKDSRKDWVSPGTTITLVIITPWLIGVFWIGDSPAYLLDGSGFKRLTKPHNVIEELVKQGIPREKLAGQKNLESTLVRCVGYKDCEPDFTILPYSNISTVLVGSDGVFGYLSEQDIQKILQNSDSYKLDVSENLVQKALENDSDDNLTVIVSVVMPQQNKPTRILNRETRIYGSETEK